MFKKIIYILICAVCLLFVRAEESFVLQDLGGDITLYLYSASSAAETVIIRQNEKFGGNASCVKGESCLAQGVSDAQTVLDFFAAETVFTETLSDSVNYYAYSPVITRYALRLNGRKINLHISVDGNIVTVGSPLIFGSF